jgi:hypothetical protein
MTTVATRWAARQGDALDSRSTGSSFPGLRPRLVHDDGTPTVWLAFIGVLAPGLVVLLIVAAVIAI